VKNLIKETIQPVLHEQARLMDDQLRTMILPKIEAAVKQDSQTSNIKKII
jgi:hypothetical protein